MHNNPPYGHVPEGYRPDWNQQWQRNTHFMYVNQGPPNPNVFSEGPRTTLVNPHFQPKTKVFVNPNFSGIKGEHSGPSIHVNPRLRRELVPPTSCLIHVNPHAKNVQVHINPKFKNALSSAPPKVQENEKTNKVLVLTKTKLIRAPKRRNSIKSKYKIVRNEPVTKKHIVNITPKRTNSVKSRYKIIRAGVSPRQRNPTKSKYKLVRTQAAPKNLVNSRFKVDNRLKKPVRSPQKRAKLLSTSLVIKGRTAQRSLVIINGVAYTKHRNSLRRVPRAKAVPNSKKLKIIRKQSPKKAKPSPKKLKKCNIPCPFYRKYGVCKGRLLGKCFWKHNPDQIALCTRFLQGACLKEKCHLSHNVSPEKMPTCKYYLEGSCSKEACPYLHVKISPKAEVCRDFLEGFCKKAQECDKRHQYLCPDYEKYGECLKQRCPYPHGKMVRTYLINKKFARKCSELHERSKGKKEQAEEKRRYYVEEGSKLKLSESEKSTSENSLGNFVGLQSRPKLGSLPAFIPFGDL